MKLVLIGIGLVAYTLQLLMTIIGLNKKGSIKKELLISVVGCTTVTLCVVFYGMILSYGDDWSSILQRSVNTTDSQMAEIRTVPYSEDAYDPVVQNNYEPSDIMSTSQEGIQLLKSDFSKNGILPEDFLEAYVDNCRVMLGNPQIHSIHSQDSNGDSNEFIYDIYMPSEGNEVHLVSLHLSTDAEGFIDSAAIYMGIIISNDFSDDQYGVFKGLSEILVEMANDDLSFTEAMLIADIPLGSNIEKRIGKYNCVGVVKTLDQDSVLCFFGLTLRD